MTAVKPTPEEIETARRIVAEADLRAAQEASAAQQAARAPLVAFLTGSEDSRAALDQLMIDFAADRDVSVHLNALSIGFAGLIAFTGYMPPAIKE